MDIKKYMTLRDRGLITVETIDAEKKFVQRRFDPDTGDEVDGEEQDIDTGWVDARIAVLQDEIDNLKAMKADLQKSIEKI